MNNENRHNVLIVTQDIFSASCIKKIYMNSSHRLFFANSIVTAVDLLGKVYVHLVIAEGTWFDEYGASLEDILLKVSPKIVFFEAAKQGLSFKIDEEKIKKYLSKVHRELGESKSTMPQKYDVRNILHSSEKGIVVIDDEGIVKYLNLAAETLFYYRIDVGSYLGTFSSAKNGQICVLGPNGKIRKINVSSENILSDNTQLLILEESGVNEQVTLDEYIYRSCLLVSGSSKVISSCRDYFLKAGTQIYTAESCDVAMEILQSKMIHVVMLEFGFVDGFGVRFDKTIKDKWPEVIIVYLLSEKQADISVGFSDFYGTAILKEPFSSIEGLPTVLAAIDRISSFGEQNKQLKDWVDSDLDVLTALNDTSLGIVVLDEMQVVKYINKSANDMFMGRVCTGSFLGTPAISGKKEMSLLGRGGEVRNVEIQCEQLGLSSEKNWLITLNDITGQKKTRMALDTLRAEHLPLIEVNKDLKSFAHAAAHDLKAPLRTISGFAQLIQEELEGTISDEIKSYFSIIHSSCVKLQERIQATLSYAQASEKELSIKPVSVNTLVEHVLSILDADLKNANMTVDLWDLPVLNLDEEQFSLLFQNLISNSISYRRDIDSKLLIFFERFEEHCEIVLEDNGQGFEQSAAEKIFQPFKRFTEVGSGSGIGLATVKKIVDRHGGSIEATGRKQRGAKFIIKLPLSVVVE